MTIAAPASLKHQDLEQIAMATLQVARFLMEAGARAEVVHECCSLVAGGLGAEGVELRSGYASLCITVTSGLNTITRMVEVGPHGVDHRLDHAIRRLARRVRQDRMTPAGVSAELARLKTATPRHPPWVVALAVGVACAAFGRLFGVDWPAFAPVAAAGAVGQAVRHALQRRGANPFVVAAGIAFLSACLGGTGAKLAGSATVDLAMIASALLLVPGVPAVNALSDIMEGHPTLGSARSVSVAMIVMFVAIGVSIAQAIVEALP